jgi:1-aminocyclopropane-1-carboxylate deaminase/D-cysteine desulfhydrase-like pyridoxal-dependent ACC family enzyme
MRKLRNKNKALKAGILPAKYVVKKCNFCEKSEEHSFNYTYRANGSPEYKSRCITCMRKYYKERAKKNRKKISKSSTERRRKRKEMCITYKGGKCGGCGYVGAGREMTFHHRTGVDKVKNISQMLDSSWSKLKAELDKCSLLCFRCHMQREDMKVSERL